MTQIKGDWLTRDATQGLFDLYEAAGNRLFVVGGSVRNALLNEDVSDIDMASDARPDEAMEFLTAAGERVIPTGLDHGTITVVRNGIPHEITTFRKDVETDGRRAVVGYADTIEEDALRRDFTINALYADRHGQVLDPQNGLRDIAARRVRFIEDADARIREDYLRILRFFRFHARYARTSIDAETLDAIARNIDGLGQLSVERITGELLKLFGVADPAPTVATMKSCGVLTAVLPGADDIFLAPLVHVQAELGIPSDPAARLAALGGDEMRAGLRLSKQMTKMIKGIRDGAGSANTPAVLGHQLGLDVAAQAVALRHAMFSTSLKGDEMTDIQRGASAVFPVKSVDLSNTFQGKALGDALKERQADWYASDLTLTRAQLLG